MATWKSVYSIPWYDYSESITNVNLPRELENIGQSAFYGCVNLSSITIPEGVTSIGYEAFYMCRSMSAITLGNNLKTISDKAFYSCYGLTSLTIPENVTYIGSNAFAFCSKLASVEIPNSVTRIESNAFNSCSSLTSVILPNNITYIPQYTFYNCFNLTSIEIPNGVTRIEKNAFCGCKSLNKIVIPSTVRIIDSEALFGCGDLKTIENMAITPQPINNTVFSGNTDLPEVDKSACTLYVPIESIEAYKAAEGWKDFTSILPILGTEPTCPFTGTCGAEGDNLTWELSCDGVLTISGTGEMADYSFSTTPWYAYSDNIMQIKVSNGVTRIGESAFQSCTMADSIILGTDILSIGEYAMYHGGSSNLTTIICNAITPPVLGNAKTLSYGCSIIVPCSSLSAYKENWSSYKNNIRCEGESYIIRFVNFDGTELQSGEVEYGETPVYTGDTPAKPADAQYTYTFSGWTPEIVAATSDATYMAVFESIAVPQDTTFIHDGENTDLDGDMETVIVQPGGELNINASGVSIGVLVITADGIHSGQIHHGELPITADHIYLEYILNPWGTTASPNRWYAFAVPFEVDINGGISRSCDNKPLVSGTDFLILEYNGLWRALQGKGWSKKLDGTLEPGNFYMLGIDGTCNRWRFEKKSGRPFEGAAHMPYNDYASGNPKDAGWNGMGNTRLEYSGMNMGGAGIEYMVTYDNRFGKYETHRIEEMDLFVGQPFFIQAEHGGFFDFLHKGSPYLMAARSKKTSLPMMHLTLTNENNTAGTDHLYLTLHEDTDGGYTIGRDVIRMSTDCKTAAQLWCTAEDGTGTQLSAHGIAEPQTETVVPVEFFVPKDGEYQLEMSARAMDGYEVELLHNGTHAATLSDAQPVTIDLSAGTNSDYSVCVHRKTPTGLDQVPSDKVQCTKVLRDGQLVIIRNGVEYNADGKMLK